MANSSDEFSQAISEEVTCPVCLEELKEPKMLITCSHNVCTVCLERMFKNKNLMDIACPVCRKPTPIPKGGLRCLPTNAAIVRVVEATLARKAKIEMKESLATGKPMVELLARKISEFDKPLRVSKEIHEKADKLVDVIRDQEESLCREVEEYYDINSETINEEKSNLDKLHSSASKSVQEAETILKQTLSDSTKTIDVAKVLKEQIEEITELHLSQNTSRENLEFESSANISSTFENEMFGKLTKNTVLNTNYAALDDLPRIPCIAWPCTSKPKISSQTTLSSKDKKPNPFPHGTGENRCDFCGMAANLICKPCLKTICSTCRYAYVQDICPPTKREHQFEDINEQSSNANETQGNDSSSMWLCERCTFLNSSNHRKCAVCATSKGVNQVAMPKSGSRKCQNCTYTNEGATVCEMCSHIVELDMLQSYF